MIEKEILFLTIPFLALLVGFVFTYIHVWHNKSKREASESQITEDIVAKLREQKTEDIQENTQEEKELNEPEKELLAHYLAEKKRWEGSYEAMKSTSEQLSKLAAEVRAIQRNNARIRTIDFGIGNSMEGYLGETKAAMQTLSLHLSPDRPHNAPQGYYGSVRVRGPVKTREVQVKGARSKTK